MCLIVFINVFVDRPHWWYFLPQSFVLWILNMSLAYFISVFPIPSLSTREHWQVYLSDVFRSQFHNNSIQRFFSFLQCIHVKIYWRLIRIFQKGWFSSRWNSHLLCFLFLFLWTHHKWSSFISTCLRLSIPRHPPSSLLSPPDSTLIYFHRSLKFPANHSLLYPPWTQSLF